MASGPGAGAQNIEQNKEGVLALRANINSVVLDEHFHILTRVVGGWGGAAGLEESSGALV